jgi:protein-tyrosine phosphatase
LRAFKGRGLSLARPTLRPVEGRWIELDGLSNLRDVGGLPTVDGGKIKRRRLLRSENPKDLTRRDVEFLLGLGLTDVVDLRSDYEIGLDGRNRLSRHRRLRVHRHSMFREWGEGVGEEKPDVRPEVLPAEAVPWADLTPDVALENEAASHYFSYLVDRPDSVLAALRAIGRASGAVLVHCAAGKDRTGTIVALALLIAGADRDAVVEDYAASTERIEAVVRRLLGSEVYEESLRETPLSAHFSRPETMIALLDYVESQYGGVAQLLARIGWTDEDTARLRAKLRD